MPAKSRSQQRLFGMVHAYNKGELRGSRSLLRRVSAVARHISDEDAYHFAKTRHADLPEKKAQAVMRPDEIQELYAKLPTTAVTYGLTRSERRRSVLDHVLSGSAAGAAVGGVGFGLLGHFLSSRAIRDSPRAGGQDARELVRNAALRCGLLGAGKGAAAGAAVGLGLGILDKMRG